MNSFYLTAQAQPKINSFSPASGFPGTIVTILGENFSEVPANNKVYFGAVAGTVNKASANFLEVIVPFGFTYKPVSVTASGLTGYSQIPFKLLYSSCSGIGPNSFSAPVTHATGGVNIEMGDIDGDSWPDIVFSNFDAKAFSVLQNRGIPGVISFTQRRDFGGVESPYGIALGDFDGDGKTDVVLSSFRNGISVYRNTSVPGNVSFEPLVRLAAGDFTYQVVVTDCDLDGRPDIIATNHDSNPGSISIFHNTSATGVLSFEPRRDFFCGNAPRDLEVGDIDGDGKPEIITANQRSGSISILKNVSTTGTISYLPPMDILMPARSYAESVVLGDINGDNKPDIVVANNNDPGTVSILINAGTPGNLAFNSPIDFAAGKNPYKIALEDFDGDGKTDLAVTNQMTYDISILKNTSVNGHVSFATSLEYPVPKIGTPRPLCIGDLDKDGRLDLIAGNGNVIVLKNGLFPDPCSNIKLKGNDSVCLVNDTITYFIVKSPDCKGMTQFRIDVDSSNAFIAGFTDTSVKIIFAQAGVVKLFASLARLCDPLKDSLTIHVFNSPNKLDLGVDKIICPDVADTLKANSGFKRYQWQDGSTDSILVITSPGLYYVTAFNYCNDIFKDTINVTATPAEVIRIGSDTTICKNEPLILSASPGFSSYIWSPDYNISNTTSREVTIFPGVPTIYKVTGIKSTGCTAKDSIAIDLYPASPIYLGNDTSFCKGGSMILYAGPGFLNYHWSTGDTTNTITAFASGDYIVSALDSNYCVSKDTFKILSVFQNPVVRLPKDSFLCAGNELLLDAGAGFTHYLWSDGSTLGKFKINNIGKYWVKVTDANQCSGSDTIDIKSIHPIPENFVSANFSFCKGQSISLSSLSEFPSYSWSTGEITKSIHVSNAGTYWLQVTDASGCKAKEHIQARYKDDCIQGIYFSNAFTPNRDGFNDIFKPQVFTPLKSFYMIVYNRFGVKVFESYDWNKGWDGKYKGVVSDPGIFVWHSRYQFINGESHAQKGVVTLIR